MVRSDAHNKEVALARIKRLASSGLALEPFVRTVFQLVNDAVPANPNRGINLGTAGSDEFICTTPETERALPAHHHYFVQSAPAISGARFRMNLDTLPQRLVAKTIWPHDEVFAPDLFRAEGFNEAYRPLEWHHSVGLIFRELNEYLGYFGIWRSIDQKPYSREDIAFLASVAGHISHGLKVAQIQSSGPSEKESFAPLAGWNAGTILMDGNGRPIAMDAQARLIFQSIGVLDGVNVSAFSLPRLHVAFDYITQALEGIFHDPASGSSAAGPPVARVYAHWSGIMLQLRGLQMIGADGREYTTILVERGETTDSRRRRLAARWGLSQREAEVLNLIVESKTGPEISILLGISHETVRKHTSSIFAKLGVETRAAAAAVARDFT